MIKTIYIICSFSMVFACYHGSQKVTQSEDEYYQERLTNILDSDELMRIRKISECIELITIQPNRCNICNSRSFEFINNSKSNAYATYYLFISAEGDSIGGLKKDLSINDDYIVYITPQRAARLGFNSMEIIKAVVCNGKFQNYQIISE